MEKVFRYNDWQEDRLMQALPLAFTDRANRFYDSQDDEVKRSYALLKTAFMKEFSPPEKTYARKTELYNLKQKGDFETYVTRFEELANCLKLDDTTKMDLFIHGLDKSLKNYLILKQPKTLAEAVRKARLKASLRDEDDKNDLSKKLIERIEALSSQKSKDDEDALLQKVIKKMEEKSKVNNVNRSVNFADPVESRVSKNESRNKLAKARATKTTTASTTNVSENTKNNGRTTNMRSMP